MDRIDGLTGLYNRTGFMTEVEQRLDQTTTERYDIIYFDIMNFKLVNADYGSERGDRLLQEVGELLRENVMPLSIYGRLAEDRFCALVPVAYRDNFINVVMSTEFFVGTEREHYQIHINAGIYEIENTSIPVTKMVDKARMALDTIKGNRMTRVAIYDDSMFQELIEEHRLSSQLPRALKEEQMKLYLQPQVNRLGQVIGAEALMRWEHPERGLLMPGDFLPYFEKNYMIVSTDQYMWEKACMLLRKWKDEGRTDWYVAVNISPSDFEYVDVCEELGELVKKYEIDPAKLRVEITETTIMQNPRRQIKLIGRLRLAGFYVEMDDFGSGYSSFAMLKDIHVDALKLDMNFLSRNGNDDRGKKILKAMADLVEELKMTMVAEGVENLDQVEYLRQIGCDVYQGYYFGKPVTVEEFEKVFSVNDEKRVGA